MATNIDRVLRREAVVADGGNEVALEVVPTLHGLGAVTEIAAVVPAHRPAGEVGLRVARSNTSISEKAKKPTSAGRTPITFWSIPVVCVGSPIAHLTGVSSSRIRHTAALPAKERLANGDENAPRAVAGLTVRAPC
jgi:hypothetical protein